MATYYSSTGDLLLGDMELGENFDSERYVRAAHNEINSRLGFIYVLPIEVEAESASALLLNKICNFLASGRLILAQAVGGEDQQVQAYGRSLIRDAFTELGLILNGDLPLQDAELIGGSPAARVPSIKNRDAVSAVEAFEDEFFMRSGFDAIVRPCRDELSPSVWTPGE